jgi:hypothetical protein
MVYAGEEQTALATTGLALLMGLSLTSRASAAGHEQDRDDADEHGRHCYSEHDRDYMRNRYHDRDRDNQLLPGMSKSDRLPPGLEKQLRVRGTLPHGLRKKLMRSPEEIEHRLPTPPPDCAHVVIGRHVALVNRNTYMVLDIFHFEQ